MATGKKGHMKPQCKQMGFLRDRPFPSLGNFNIAFHNIKNPNWRKIANERMLLHSKLLLHTQFNEYSNTKLKWSDDKH